MRKIIASVAVIIVMLAMCTVPAFAKVSPSAKPSTDASSGDAKSPQTGDSVVLYGSLGILMAVASTCLAVKKIKE